MSQSPNQSAIRNPQSAMASPTILPGAIVGVLGGGQLGRMFAMAARRLGYRVHTLAPEHDTPTGQIADVEINASYDDVEAVRAFANSLMRSTSSYDAMTSTSAICPVGVSCSGASVWTR